LGESAGGSFEYEIDRAFARAFPAAATFAILAFHAMSIARLALPAK